MDGKWATPTWPLRLWPHASARGGRGHIRLSAALLGACLVSIPMASPERTAASALARTDSDAVSVPPFSEEPAQSEALTFDAAFDPLGPPSPRISPQPGAVDLSTITPLLGPQVIRTLGTGVASYYGKRFHGRLTANGERFNMNAMTAAHKTLPFGTAVRVTNPANGRSVTVRINDRGPFIRGRTIDLSRAAARKLRMISRGHARVKLEIVRR